MIVLTFAVSACVVDDCFPPFRHPLRTNTERTMAVIEYNRCFIVKEKKAT